MRRHIVPALAVAFLTLNIAACATGMDTTTPKAPQPAKSVDAARFYAGTWYEAARNPMKLTDGCVAGITAFSRDDKGRIIDRDSCRMGDPDTGKEKVLIGPVTILDTATNAKFITRYRLVGPLGPSRTYWVLDHDDAYSWFISATPDLKNLSVFTRDAHIPLLERGRIVDRARALGYDGLLEYPVTPRR